METEAYLAEQDVYRKCSSWNVEYGHVAKKCSKLVRVHSCRGNYEFQISASRYNLVGDRRDTVECHHSDFTLKSEKETTTTSQGHLSFRHTADAAPCMTTYVRQLCTDLAQQAEQHISIQGAFVSLVHDNSTVVVQVRLPQ